MAPSNTPPCNAVYDGCNYYYLPWSSEKPCVCVESYWENIAFRLEPLNTLLRIIDRVVRLAIARVDFRGVSSSYEVSYRFPLESNMFFVGSSHIFSKEMCIVFPGYLLCFPGECLII